MAVFALAVEALLAAERSDLATGVRRDGFEVNSVTELPDVAGRLVRMTHVKSGADLAWLDRDDDNKTFAIGFRTFPGDDTGVAHIIEHSVLCGSEKYPVKEPFVDLLKSSFATFLNAWTSSDSTMYPVSSRNDRDFANLVDVYMDAVLHPLSVKSPLAFRQEGWHYELDAPDGELKRSGVVYSEMKGAYANPDRILGLEMDRLLFPDVCYGKSSGGDPAETGIPTLTFGKYRAFYERHYHPSHARIFLDGRVDVAKILPLLDGYLKPYARVGGEVPVEYQKPVAKSASVPYEIGAGESPEGKVIVADGWVFGRFDEREKIVAMDVVTDALADSNEAPLKKALLGRGLCDDVSFWVDAAAQAEVQVRVKNVKRENVAEVRRIVRETLAAAADGLDRARLAALLDRAEFRTLEKQGLDHFCDAYSLWLYGGDPAAAFRPTALFASLRAKLATGWFERVLREAVVANPHHAEVTLVPSPTLAAERLAAEKRTLAAVKAGWTEEETRRVIAEAKALKAHQEGEDDPKDVAKLPRLTLADVPVKGKPVVVTPTEAGCAKALRVKTQANGIVHAVLHFSLADLSDGELSDAALLAELLGELPTAKRDVLALRNALDATVGNRAFHTAVYARTGDPSDARPYLVTGFSALAAKRDAAAALMDEVLLETSFADAKAVGRIVRQLRRDRERAACGLPGRNFARRRAVAQVSAAGAVDERFAGFEALRRLQAQDEAFDRDGAALCARLAALAKRIFTRARLTLAVSDNAAAGWEKAVAAPFPRGETPVALARRPLPRRAEGFVTPGRIASAAMAAYPTDRANDGRDAVAARILSLDYLWDEIRVKGGAYGGGFSAPTAGAMNYLSWNDPKPKRTLGVYGTCGAALAAFAKGDEALDRYVISTVARTEPLRRPYEELADAAALVLSGKGDADRQKLRAEILRTTKADLAGVAKRLDAAHAEMASVVVGGSALVDTCTNASWRVEQVSSLK